MSRPRMQTVLLDMGGVVLGMAGGHGFPQTRLDFRGRQAVLEAIRRTGGRAMPEDLESLLFGPWRRDYDRREEKGCEADWGPHLDRLRTGCGGRWTDLELLELWFRPYAEHLVPLAGVTTTLAELRRMDLQLALVSNVPLPGALYRQVLERHDLDSLFHVLCFSYDHGTRKPSPALLRRALDATGGDPTTAVMVGDRRDRDIAAGKFAGTATVWVESADDGGPEADAVIAGLAELPDLLRDWQR